MDAKRAIKVYHAQKVITGSVQPATARSRLLNNSLGDAGRIPSFVAAYVTKAHLEKLYIAVDINVTSNISSIANSLNRS